LRGASPPPGCGLQCDRNAVACAKWRAVRQRERLPTPNGSGRIASGPDVPARSHAFAAGEEPEDARSGMATPEWVYKRPTRVRISARWRERGHATVRTPASPGGLFFHSHGEKDLFASWIDENRKA